MIVEKNAIRREFDFFEENKQEFIAKYLDKFIVLKNYDVQGSFDTLDEAFSYASENFEVGTYLIQQCSKEKEIRVFHSRAYL